MYPTSFGCPCRTVSDLCMRTNLAEPIERQIEFKTSWCIRNARIKRPHPPKLRKESINRAIEESPGVSFTSQAE
jgi:hypothetical protein